MGQRRLSFFAAVFVFLGCSTALVATPEVLMKVLIPSLNFPAGTLITWAVMISLPTAIYYAFPQFESPESGMWLVYKRVFQIAIALGVVWGIVSYGFSGNWNYSFSSAVPGWQGSPRASLWFWNWTKIVGALPFLLLLVLLLHLTVRWLLDRFA